MGFCVLYVNRLNGYLFTIPSKGLGKHLIRESDNEKCILKRCLIGLDLKTGLLTSRIVFRMETEKTLVHKSGTHGKEMPTGCRSYVQQHLKHLQGTSLYLPFLFVQAV